METHTRMRAALPRVEENLEIDWHLCWVLKELPTREEAGDSWCTAPKAAKHLLCSGQWGLPAAGGVGLGGQ